MSTAATKKRRRTLRARQVAQEFEINPLVFAGDLTVDQLRQVLRARGVDASVWQRLKKGELVRLVQDITGNVRRVTAALNDKAATTTETTKQLDFFMRFDTPVLTMQLS